MIVQFSKLLLSKPQLEQTAIFERGVFVASMAKLKPQSSQTILKCSPEIPGAMEAPEMIAGWRLESQPTINKIIANVTICFSKAHTVDRWIIIL